MCCGVSGEHIRYFYGQVGGVLSKTGEVVWFCGENGWECINVDRVSCEMEGDGGESR